MTFSCYFQVQSELSDVRVELESLKRSLEAESKSKSDLEGVYLVYPNFF